MLKRYFGTVLMGLCLAACFKPPAPPPIKWQTFAQDGFSIRVPTDKPPQRTQKQMKSPPPLADMTIVDYMFEGEDGTFRVYYSIMPVFTQKEGEKPFFDWANTGLPDGVILRSQHQHLMYTEERQVDGHPARIECYEVPLEGEKEKGQMKLLHVLVGNRVYYVIATTIPDAVSPGAQKRAEDFLNSLKFRNSGATT